VANELSRATSVTLARSLPSRMRDSDASWLLRAVRRAAPATPPAIERADSRSSRPSAPRRKRRNFLTRHPPANDKIPPHGAAVGGLRRRRRVPDLRPCGGPPSSACVFLRKYPHFCHAWFTVIGEDFVNRALGPRPYVVERPTMPNANDLRCREVARRVRQQPACR
jgi:hypothetical protein